MEKALDTRNDARNGFLTYGQVLKLELSPSQH